MPFDFNAVVAPFRMQPGLRRLPAGATQITPTQPGDRWFAEKLHVLTHWPLDALVAAPGFDPRPALNALCTHAAQEHPDTVAWDGDAAFVATRLGWRVHGDSVGGDGPPEIGACLRALSPSWRLPALLSLAFAEDFAVIDGTTAQIPWIAACLPSHWDPRDKVGHHFAEVHGPVADNQVLVSASAHLARLVTGSERWERFVWTVTHRVALQAHPAHVAPSAWPEHADADGLAAVARFRTERQTFIPVAEAAQAVFTIRVDSVPLADALAATEHARRLHDAIASMSPAVLAYRGLAPARDRLLAWLAARAAA